MAVMVIYYFTGGQEEIASGRVIQLAEAAFDSEGSFSDATAFLVGSFTDQDGNLVSFSGGGRFERSLADGSGSEIGEYSLMTGGSYSMIRFVLGRGEPVTYQFELNSSDGEILLTAMDGAKISLKPLI